MKALSTRKSILLSVFLLCWVPFSLQAQENISPPNTSKLVYMSHGHAYVLHRTQPASVKSRTDNAASVFTAWVEGPNKEEKASGIQSVFPDATVLDKMDVTENHVNLYLHIPMNFLKNNIDDLTLEEIGDSFGKTIYEVSTTMGGTILVYDEDSKSYRNIHDFLQVRPPPEKKVCTGWESDTVNTITPSEQNFSIRATVQPGSFAQGQPAGFLSGKSIFLSPGHGWYYTGTGNTWTTQRGVDLVSGGTVEDFNTVESVDQYLVQYLWNSGAYVYTCRERSMNSNEVIIDNGGTGYSETGVWTTSSSASGYYGTGYRFLAVSGSSTGSALWRPTIPADGYYPVYVWYNGGVGSNRPPDAHYIIHHSGGDTLWTQNQTHDGSTWKHIGTYYFLAGTTGYVLLTNQSSTTGVFAIADAVRFGGGMGSIVRNTATSGKPRFEECSRYYAQFMGAPSSTYHPGASADNTDDVGTRPRYANWEAESWEDPIFVSWHTNASGGTGTESYIYDTADNFAISTGDQFANPGSYSLETCVQNEIINDIRKGWYASWTDRGHRMNWFGEVNPAYASMPQILVEIGFHDTTADDTSMRDARFEQIVARAMYQGIAKYFAGRDAQTVQLLPDPPQRLVVKCTGPASVQLTWRAPTTDSVKLVGDAATTYRIYISLNGRGFGNSIPCNGTSTTLSNLTANTLYFFKVSAANNGGESFPTPTLAVRTPNSGTPQILLVNGFDRLDKFLDTQEYYNASGWTIATTSRIYLTKMNTYDYSIQHGNSLAASSAAFDAADHQAVIAGDISLTSYKMVDWISGLESNADKTFDATEQSILQTYLTNSGNLFVSGDELAWDLDNLNNGKTFYNNYLKAVYVGDDASTYNVNAGTGAFNGLSSFSFDNGSNGIYDVAYPDKLNANGTGSSVNLTYIGGAGGNAGIQYDGTGTGYFKIVNLGFPFESITSSSLRDSMMNKILTFFQLTNLSVKDWTLFD